MRQTNGHRSLAWNGTARATVTWTVARLADTEGWPHHSFSDRSAQAAVTSGIAAPNALTRRIRLVPGPHVMQVDRAA